MTDDLVAEIKAQRMVLERILVLIPTERLNAWVTSEEDHLSHIDGGGETIPPTTPVDRRASELALEYYHWGAGQRSSFRLDDPG